MKPRKVERKRDAFRRGGFNSIRCRQPKEDKAQKRETAAAQTDVYFLVANTRERSNSHRKEYWQPYEAWWLHMEKRKETTSKQIKVYRRIQKIEKTRCTIGNLKWHDEEKQWSYWIKHYVYIEQKDWQAFWETDWYIGHRRVPSIDNRKGSG